MTKDRKDYITLLSVISAIAVVYLHSNGCFWQYSKDRYWFTANVIECIFYFAVPIFFMITGANLIDYQKKYSTKEYFKKRLKKTVIPFIIWSLIGLMFQMFFEKTISLNDLSIEFIIDGIINTKFVGIYWFFIPLFCIYLLIPLLASVEDNKKKSIFSYLVIICFIFNSLIPFLINIFKIKIVFSPTTTIRFDYIIYVLIGYLLTHHELKPKSKKILYLLAVIGLLIHIIGTYILSRNAGMIVETYKGYNNVPCIIYSTGVFVLIKELSTKKKNYKLINTISTYTFPIYLMHWYLLIMITKILKLSSTSILYRLGMPFIVIIISIIITNILRKIPILKRIVP